MIEWISTQERLPDRGKRVLAIIDGHAHFAFISTYGLPMWHRERHGVVPTPSHWAEVTYPETSPTVNSISSDGADP